MKFNVFHRETGLSLKEYAKQYRIKDWDYSREKITVIIGQSGWPGFTYRIPYEGDCVVWLHENEWEVRERVKSNDVPDNQKY